MGWQQILFFVEIEISSNGHSPNTDDARENPMKVDEWGYPYFGNPHTVCGEELIYVESFYSAWLGVSPILENNHIMWVLKDFFECEL